MNIVAAALVIPDRASGYTGPISQIRLRPIQKAARRATERGRQYFAAVGLTHFNKLPILVDSDHIDRFCADFQRLCFASLDGAFSTRKV